MPGEAVIEISGLSFTYGDGFALEDVNLRIEKGQFVSVVGPNGGGKTTLLKLLLGLIRPSSGKVRVFGQAPEKARSRIGYMPQHTQADPFFPVTVMEVALMGRVGGFGRYRDRDREAARRALSDVGLGGMETKSFAALSGGQRQRVLIARALSSDPELLLLDEPTANLDFRVADDFYELLKRLGEKLTIVLVSHDMGLVAKAVESVVCVNRRCALHPTSDLTPELLNEVYGQTMRVVRHDQKL